MSQEKLFMAELLRSGGISIDLWKLGSKKWNLITREDWNRIADDILKMKKGDNRAEFGNKAAVLLCRTSLN